MNNYLSEITISDLLHAVQVDNTYGIKLPINVLVGLKRREEKVRENNWRLDMITRQRNFEEKIIEMDKRIVALESKNIITADSRQNEEEIVMFYNCDSARGNSMNNPASQMVQILEIKPNEEEEMYFVHDSDSEDNTSINSQASLVICETPSSSISQPTSNSIYLPSSLESDTEFATQQMRKSFEKRRMTVENDFNIPRLQGSYNKASTDNYSVDKDCDLCEFLHNGVWNNIKIKVLSHSNRKEKKTLLSEERFQEIEEYNKTVQNQLGIICNYCGAEQGYDCHCHFYDCKECSPEYFCEDCGRVLPSFEYGN